MGASMSSKARETVASLVLGKLRVDAVTQAQALAIIDALVEEGTGGRVYTPNIDHVVMAESDRAFAEAYERVALSLADGFPLVATSKLTKVKLPEKVSGSDLVMPLMAQAAEKGRRVFFFGGAPGVGEAAKAKLLERYPTLQVVGIAAPKVDLSASDADLRALAAPILESKADYVLVALGAPKQEIFIDRVADVVRPAVLLGIGASLDFVAGRVKRAPRWMSENGLEWLYRLNQERGRLWRRYVRDTKYPYIVLKHYLLDQRSRGGR